jgi:hypothetical protein
MPDPRQLARIRANQAAVGLLNGSSKGRTGLLYCLNQGATHTSACTQNANTWSLTHGLCPI